MRSMTTAAFGRLLEPNTSTTKAAKRYNHDDNSKQKQKPGNQRGTSNFYFSPALYATPQPGPIPPDSSVSSPTSPSPYLFNRKRRQLPAKPTVTAAPPPPRPPPPPSAVAATSSVDANGSSTAAGDEAHDDNNKDEKIELEKEEEHHTIEEEEDDFFDPRESMSSSSETDEGSTSRSPSAFLSGWRTSFSSSSPYFYDANEDLWSDSSVPESSPSYRQKSESELQILKTNIAEEIEKRKEAEKTLEDMQKKWKRMAECLHQAGLSFPKSIHDGDTPPGMDPELVAQEIIVTKLVSEAIQRGVARAEAEEVAEKVIESKNLEISRLRDRLQYYEAVNREMSQRNQEVVEFTRQKRIRRRRRQKLVWGCIGLSITVGASLLAYSYAHNSESAAGDSSAEKNSS